jgi:hypothetical protein
MRTRKREEEKESMSNQKTSAFVIGGVIVIGTLYLSLGGGIEYGVTDVRDVNRDELFAKGYQLLEDSEAWPVELDDQGTVRVASTLDVYPVRTIRYDIEVEADFEAAVAYVKDETYSGEGRRELEDQDKWELTLYQRDWKHGPYEWVRRSVHIAPPPGGDRDAVVLYMEDRPDPKTYVVAFQSVESLEGKPWPEVEDAIRFMVYPSIYKVEETAPGKVRIRKVEGVDPRGAMSPLLNNHIISKLFFRRFMFEQAKSMRDILARAKS